MLGDLLNEFIKNRWYYQIESKMYYVKIDDLEDEYKDIYGIHIYVKLNSDYTISIVLAYDKAHDEFYGDDIWEIALANYHNGTYLYHVPDDAFGYPYETVILCRSDEIVKWINKYIEHYNIKVNKTLK